jgi:isopentenyl diphosphate isomerase/L-lactate dehydrogenase-like FMN-dependent dehydrogenase
MLDVVKADVDVAMALTGHRSFVDLDRSALCEAAPAVR